MQAITPYPSAAKLELAKKSAKVFPTAKTVAPKSTWLIFMTLETNWMTSSYSNCVDDDASSGLQKDDRSDESERDQEPYPRVDFSSLHVEHAERADESDRDQEERNVDACDFEIPLYDKMDSLLVSKRLAKMEVVRTNLQNMVFRYIELTGWGKQMTLAEASAMKLYAAQSCMEVTTEAVQVFGGMGYMREARVEQLMRDAKILQIYAGTDEMQVIAIAKDLLSR